MPRPSEVNVEIVSVALFRRAHELGVAITRRWIDEQLERLGSHPPGCRCPEPCHLRVSASKVHRLAASWQRQYGRAQVLARR
jgi:hypothetical protein